jgi:hypothetical protein
VKDFIKGEIPVSRGVKFGHDSILPMIDLMMEAARSSETSAHFYETIWRYIAECCHLEKYRFDLYAVRA